MDLSTRAGQVMLRHEQEHVHQQQVLGVFYPLFYWTMSLGLLFCRSAHHIYDNSLEVDARRTAGQVIDVVGVVKYALEIGKMKHVQRDGDK